MHTQEVKLHDNETLYKANLETGEMNEIKSSKARNPNVVNFKQDEKFIKTFPESWKLLYNMTTPLEYKVANKMSTMTKMLTNSLEPLDDDYTYHELSIEFDISIGKVKSTFDKLFSLGVFGKFEVYNSDFKHTKFWVFNPYLSINGKAIDKNSLGLFINTVFAKV